ncbi:MAG: ChaN family lipoprotein [Planctomycetota bacterium]
MIRSASLLLLLPCLLLGACQSAPLEYGEVVDDLAEYDVVFLGEKHDSAAGHAIQRRLLERLHAKRADIVLAMEMFERDVQSMLDDYLGGKIDETAFLAASRPWGDYSTDYRPMVEFAKQHGLRVIAANAPRSEARRVVGEGLARVVGSPHVAVEASAPKDRYYELFVAEMGDHQGVSPEMMSRFYEAQCLKDDTMAESIVRQFDAGARPLVVHVVGSFHVDGHLGTVARVRQRRPDLRLAVLTMREVGNVVAKGADAWEVLVAKEPERSESVRVPAKPVGEKAADNATGTTATRTNTTEPAPQPSRPRGRPALGFMPDYEAGVEGVLVSALREGGPAATAGIQERDVIVQIGPVPIADVAEYMEELGNLDVDSTVAVTVKRDGKLLTFSVKVGERIQ